MTTGTAPVNALNGVTWVSNVSPQEENMSKSKKALSPVELGRASGAARRRRALAVRRIVHFAREARDLPATVTDVEVLEHVADLIAAGALTEGDG